MTTNDRYMLTTKDFTILEVMLERCLGLDDPLGAMLRRKLAKAAVVFRDDVPLEVVTLNSRVAYRIDGGPAETRIVAHDEMRGLVGLLLPLANPRGLALLGMAEGESDTILRADGTEETVTVQEVLYQPEAARRETKYLAPRGPAPGQVGTPTLRVVHRSDAVPEQVRAKTVAAANSGFDDPGPSAA